MFEERGASVVFVFLDFSSKRHEDLLFVSSPQIASPKRQESFIDSNTNVSRLFADVLKVVYNF